MLNIQTFDNRSGGNVIYKALAHPLAAAAIATLYAGLSPPVALYDPDGIAEPLLALYPGLPGLEALFMHDVAQVGQCRAGLTARKLSDLPHCAARSVLIAAFDAGRIAARIAHLLPPGASVHTLDAARLPEALLSNPVRYLDKLNFATNFAFFRDAGGLSTQLVSANYWAGYGARAIRLWLRLFSADGTVLATWEQKVPPGPAGFSIDSRAVRERFGLPEFAGQLFLHAVGATGHDVVKYALDTYASDNGASLSCTHDANAWPSDRYAGLPAPRDDEHVVLWLQNSHAVPIPAGAMALDRMGAEDPVALDRTDRTIRHTRAGCGGSAARPALARANRAALRPPRGAPALRSDPRRPHPNRPRQRGARRSASRPGHPRAAARPGPRLSAAFPDPAPRPLPQHRSAHADGGDPGRPAGAAGRVRHRGAQGGGTLPGPPAARPRAGGGLRRTFRSTAAMPNWSTTSATAAAPTAGCTPCSATRTASPATPRSPASAPTSSIP